MGVRMTRTGCEAEGGERFEGPTAFLSTRQKLLSLPTGPHCLTGQSPGQALTAHHFEWSWNRWGSLREEAG